MHVGIKNTRNAATNDTGRTNDYFSGACSLRAQLSALALALTCAAGVHAQVPAVSQVGLPSTPLIGEASCAEIDFTNAAGPTGYGPYVIGILDKGIVNTTLSFVDVTPKLEPIGTFDASGVLIDPISGQTIMGNENGTAVIARYPVGSVEQGNPPLVLEACAEVAVGAEIGVPLEVEFVPGFEFGDSATGTNAILGTPIFSTVTPQLARVEKTNSAPENERPPGPSHTFNYSWRVDVSALTAITDVAVSDDLPPEMQWTGAPITVSAPLGIGCQVTNNPNFLPQPGGIVRVECLALSGTAGTDDLVVSVPVYITDILDEAIPDQQAITNVIDLEYSFGGEDFNDSDDSTVLAVHAAAQKSVLGTAFPGDTLTYTINFQLTDYPRGPNNGADTFLFTDILPDGMAFLGTLELLVDGAAVPISEIAQVNTPAAGQTTINWDLGAALAAQGDLLTSGSTGRLRYEAQVLEQFNNGDPVLAGDTFSNTLDLDYMLTEGGSGNNGSSAETEIPENRFDKALSDPPPPAQLMPGEVVTFTLTADIPAGNTSNLTLVDYLPRPVFDVTAPAPTITVLPPFTALANAPVIDAAQNSIGVSFNPIDSAISSTVVVEVRATVTSEPFADDLFLTNLLSASYTNSAGEVFTDLRAEGLNVGAPDLVITKGVTSTSNPRAQIVPLPPGNPAIALQDSDAVDVDAFDTIDYTITIENIGGQNAYSVTVRDPDIPDKLSCDGANPTVRSAANVPLPFTGSLSDPAGLVLTNPLPGNDANPTGGGAPFSSDTALITVSCTLAVGVSPTETVINTASVEWVSTDGGSETFPRREDDASATIAAPRISKELIDSQPNYSGNVDEVHIGEIVTYRVAIELPEGTSSAVQFEDLLDEGVAFLDDAGASLDAGCGKAVCITAAGSLSTSEGTFSDVEDNAALISNGSGDTAPDRKLVVGPSNGANGFGEVIKDNGNADPDVAIDDIVIVYRTRVLNSLANQTGTSLRNRARWEWLPNGGERQNVQARADRFTILEPTLKLEKAFSPDTGDQTTPPLVTITFEQSGASNGDAFDLTMVEPLPFGLGIVGYMDPDSAVTRTNCPPESSITIDRNNFADELQIEWPAYLLGSASCTVSFQTEFLLPVVAGERLDNCSSLEWESLAAIDQPLPFPPNNIIAVERTGDPNDPGGISNDYTAEACDQFKVFDVGIAKRVSSTDQPQSDNIPGTPAGAESLTIGEVVTFELVVTVPETASLDINVIDSLPRTEMILELLSAQTLDVGDDLTPTFDDPTPNITDESGNGVNDTVSLNYGLVRHDLDGITNDRDRIRVEVVAKVLNRSENRNNDRDQNAAIVKFLPSTSASDDVDLEIVEPVLEIEKLGNKDTVEAGDDILYRIIIEHSATSRVAAEDLLLEDVLPPELSLVPGSVIVGKVCTIAPDANPVESGNGFSVRWSEFPLGAICEIDFLADVNVTALTGQRIDNTASIEWTSLNTQGDPDDRPYMLEDLWTVVISEPGLEKALVATSVASTDFGLASRSPILTIGEEATFNITASFADGTIRAVSVQDLLPDTDVALSFTDAKILSIGSDLSFEGTSPSIGDPPVPCSPATASCRQWLLGDVINSPDNRPEPDIEDTIVFEVKAVVMNDPLNSGAPGVDDNLINLAELNSPDAQLASPELFGIVEPRLSVTKLLENGTGESSTSASREHEFTIVLQHRAISTATAHNIIVRDTLDPDMLWVSDNSVESDCVVGTLAPTIAPTPGQSGIVEFEVDRLALARQSCEIKFRVRMSDTLPVPDFYPNTATITWDSTPVADDIGQTRRYLAQDVALLYAFSDAGIVKLVANTSVDDTRRDQFDRLTPDVTIGEIVEYLVIAKFTEGVTDNVFLTDTFQDDGSGQLELIGGSVVFLGDNVSASNPSLPQVIGNSIEIDYGQVTNVPDMPPIQDRNDTVVYRLELRVTDTPQNSDGDVLVNDVELQYEDILNNPRTIGDRALVDIVEPALELDKAFTDLQGAVATIRLDLTNNGTSSSFDTTITDVFDETIWVPGSLVPVSVPSGYELTESSAAGFTTVTLSASNPSIPPSPAEILSPSEVFTAIFTMTLQNDGQPGPTTIENIAQATGTSLPGVDSSERTYVTQAADNIALPALALEKTWAGPNNPALPGDLITYTLTLTSSGDSAASNVVVTDTPDSTGLLQTGSVSSSAGGIVSSGNGPGDTFIQVDYATLPPGTVATITYTVQIPLPYPDGLTAAEQLVNQATATSTELSPVLSDDPSTTPDGDATLVPVLADPVMRIEKSDNLIFGLPGDTIIYTIQYGNAGNQNASGVVISETVPANTVFDAGNSSAGWVCNGSSGGSNCTLTVGNLNGATAGVAQFAVTIVSPVPGGVITIFNSAAITEDGSEFGQPPSTPSTDVSDEETPLFARPVLEVFKNDLGISVVPGQTFRYVILYANTGAQQATGVTLTETVPDDVIFNASASLPSSWSCPDGSLPGTVCTLNAGTVDGGFGNGALFGLRVINPADEGTSLITNTVRLEDDGANSFGVLSDEATDTTPLIAAADLELRKASDGGVLSIGKVITYTLPYANIGNQNTSNVVIREIVPANTEFSADDSLPTVWSCADGAAAGTLCTYDVGALAAGAGGTVTFAVTVVDRPTSGLIINLAEIGFNGPGIDGNLGNNFGSATDRFPLPSNAIPAMHPAMLVLLALSVLLMGWRAARASRRRP